MPQDVVQNHRGLKAAVLIMGVLLIVGIIALVAGLARQSGRISQKLAENHPQHIVLPPELSGKIQQFQMDGGRLMLLIERMGARKLIMLDMESGEILMSLETGQDTP